MADYGIKLTCMRLLEFQEFSGVQELHFHCIGADAISQELAIAGPQAQRHARGICDDLQRLMAIWLSETGAILLCPRAECI